MAAVASYRLYWEGSARSSGHNFGSLGLEGIEEECKHCIWAFPPPFSPPLFFVGGARRCPGLRFESLRQATGSALPAVQMIAILPARTLALYTLYTHFCISIPPLSHSALLRWGDPVQSPVFALNFVEFQGSKPNLSGIEFRPTRATPQCAATWPCRDRKRTVRGSNPGLHRAHKLPY